MATLSTLTADGIKYDIADRVARKKLVWYGVCDTGASTAAKVVDCDEFVLRTGTSIIVKFSHTNSAEVSNLTLNVNLTGARNIKYHGGNMPSAGQLTEDHFYQFVYDGTNYEMIGDLAQFVDAQGLISILGYTPIDSALKGANSGVAELDQNGKVPSSQLPSYVDDVVEYSSVSSFPEEGESGKIYVDTTGNSSYRWSGSQYVKISSDLSLGETSSTAYRGDYGAAAYAHATAKGSAYVSGLYKITTNAEGHVTAVEAVSASDITGLGIAATDTTYTFTSGTNGFTVTPSNDDPISVTVTPSISDATTSASGLMSATDKSKLDGIATGATANVGTITGINMNGSSKGTSGVVDLGTVITSHQDISGKSDKTETVSNVAYDATNKKITKTINGTTTDVVTVATLKYDMAISSTDITTALGYTPMDSTDGAAAYAHAVTNKGSEFSEGLYKITTNAEGHVTDASLVDKWDIAGLGIPESDTTYTFSGGTNSFTVTPSGDDAVAQTVTITPSISDATTSASGLMSANDKSKLDGIAAGATANTGTITGITMNGVSKGTSGVVNLGTVITSHQDISGKADKAEAVTNVAYDSTNKKITKTINGTTTDVVSVATLKTDLSITGSDITAALGYTPIDSAIKGANNGVAELDQNGKVPSSQLPSYVDDVIEAADSTSFPATGESGKIYIALDTNKTYRWSGTTYVEISESLALGTTSSTAYRGDYGDAAYTHAVTNKGTAYTSGFYKITTNAEGHVTSATAVEKSDITSLGIPGSDTDTTYSLTQDSTDGHIITLTPSSGTAQTITIPDNNTWRPVSDAIDSNSSSDAASSKAVKLAYDLAASKTANTGTVTSVATGDGLTGGPVTTTGTIKANLKSYIKHTADSAALTNTTSRQYAIGLDKSGYLSVNVPWENTQTLTGVKGNAENSYRTGNVNLTAANIGAVAVSQGVGNAGKFLVINSSGNVEAMTMSSWQGGSY